MQHFAEQLCSTQFTPLEKCLHAAAIGLLCKLLDGTCREYLQRFCPIFQILLECATEIWNTTKLDDICSTVCQGWTELASGMQHIICDV